MTEEVQNEYTPEEREELGRVMRHAQNLASLFEGTVTMFGKLCGDEMSVAHVVAACALLITSNYKLEEQDEALGTLVQMREVMEVYYRYLATVERDGASVQ